jgi:hypothetical protein
MAAEAGERLVIDLEARVTQFEKAFAKANKTANDNFGRIERRGKQASDTLADSFTKNAGRMSAALSTIGAGFAGGIMAGGVSEIVRATRDATKAIKEMNGEAKKAGLDVERFQEFKYAADQAGVNMDGLTDGFKEMALRADELIVTGAGPAKEAFERLGYTSEELAKKLKNPGELMLEIIDRLKDLDKAAQIRVTDEIFGGTGGEEFLKFLEQGRAGIERSAAEARKLGLVIDEDIVKKGVEVDKAFDKIAQTIDTNIKTAVVSVAHAIKSWSTEAESFFNKIGNASVWEKINKALGITDPENLKAWGLEPVTPPAAAPAPGTSTTTTPSSTPAATTPKVDLSKIKVEVDKSIIDAIIGVESGGDRYAKNPKSSATGLGQFVEDTWLDIMRRHEAELVKGMSEAQILALRKDPALSRKATEYYAAENAAGLLRNGEAATGQNVYLSHFLGLGDALKVLKAAPGTPVNGLVNQRSIDSNRSILQGKTVDQVQAWAGNKVNDHAPDTIAARERAAEATKKQNEAVKELIAELGFEAEQLKRTDEQQAIHQALQRAGVTLDSAEGQAIAAKVQSLYALQQAQEAATESQERLQDSQQEFASMGKEFFSGFLSDLRQGKSLTEALGNALNRLADRLIDMALNSMFGLGQGQTGGGIFGGLFGMIAKAFGMKDGGPVQKFATGGYVSGPGGPRSDSVPARLSNGEYVVNAAATKKHAALLEAINNGKTPIGFAAGGIVGSPPAIGAPALAASAGPQINQNVTVNVDGSKSGKPEENQDLADRIGRQVKDQLRHMIGSEIAQQRRPGGMLAR